MKQLKKILCGVMLTSFVILGSVSVFAGFGDGGGDGGNDDCEHRQIVEATSTETAETFKEEENADAQFNVGNEWPFAEDDPDPILFT